MNVGFSVSIDAGVTVQPTCCVSELNPRDSDCLIIKQCWEILQLCCFCFCLCHPAKTLLKTTSAKVTMHYLQL